MSSHNLKPCVECSRPLSPKANVCPSCGSTKPLATCVLCTLPLRQADRHSGGRAYTAHGACIKRYFTPSQIKCPACGFELNHLQGLDAFTIGSVACPNCGHPEVFGGLSSDCDRCGLPLFSYPEYGLVIKDEYSRRFHEDCSRRKAEEDKAQMLHIHASVARREFEEKNSDGKGRFLELLFGPLARPCGICGNPPRWGYQRVNTLLQLSCRCGNSGPGQKSRRDARAAWNSRQLELLQEIARAPGYRVEKHLTGGAPKSP